MKQSAILVFSLIGVATAASPASARHWSAPTTPGLVAAGQIVREGQPVRLPATRGLIAAGQIIREGQPVTIPTTRGLISAGQILRVGQPVTLVTTPYLMSVGSLIVYKGSHHRSRRRDGG